jgi:hypothetical protein
MAHVGTYASVHTPVIDADPTYVQKDKMVSETLAAHTAVLQFLSPHLRYSYAPDGESNF